MAQLGCHRSRARRLAGNLQLLSYSGGWGLDFSSDVRFWRCRATQATAIPRTKQVTSFEDVQRAGKFIPAKKAQYNRTDG
jgi:hypothetical protein